MTRHYSDLDTIPLIAPVLIPVASPKMVFSGIKIANPRKTVWIIHYCMILIRQIGLYGCLHMVLIVIQGHSEVPSFEDDFLLIRAAEAGQGIALVPIEYAQTEIEAGRLVQVLSYGQHVLLITL